MKMKSLYSGSIIFVLVTGLLLSSCKKSSTSPKDNLIGTWTVGTTTYTAMVGSMTLADYFSTVLQLPPAQAALINTLFNTSLQQAFTGTIQVKSDNTYTSTLGGKNDSGTWSLSADGKTLTVTSSTQAPVTFDIIELTSNKLHVNLTDNLNEDLTGSGTPVAIVVKVDMTLNKQ